MMDKMHKPVQSGEQLKKAMDKVEKGRSVGKSTDVKTKEVDPEVFKAAVASIVLAELEMWPEEIQELIGEDHPSDEAFSKGVKWVIGAYMHIARRNLELVVKNRIKQAGVETARKMGPASREAANLQNQFQVTCAREQAINERNRIAAIEEVTEQINAEYREKQKELAAREPPANLAAAGQAILELEREYEGECHAVRSTADITFSDIAKIDDGAENWNSKNRQKYRKAHQVAKKTARDEDQKEGAVAAQAEQV